MAPPGVIDSPRISSLSNVPEERAPSRGGSPYLHQNLSGSTSTFKTPAPATSTTSLNSSLSAARPPMGPRNPSALRSASSASISQQLEANRASTTTPTLASTIMPKKIPRAKSPLESVKDKDKDKDGGREAHSGVKGSRSVANINLIPGAQPKLRSTPHLAYSKDAEPAPATLMYWSRAPVYGVMPGHGMRAHSATLIDSTAWIFGGCDERGCWKDVWCFNAGLYNQIDAPPPFNSDLWTLLWIETMQWSRPDMLGDIPPPCRAHTATLVDRRLVVFGGGEGPVYRNDVYILDTATRRWSQPRFPPEMSMPPPRRAHTAVYYRNKVWIFGGGNGTQALNDLWTLEVGPSPDKMRWELQQTKGKKPTSRGYHTANLIGNVMIIMGGSDGRECFSDIWCLNLGAIPSYRIPLYRTNVVVCFRFTSMESSQAGCRTP